MQFSIEIAPYLAKKSSAKYNFFYVLSSAILISEFGTFKSRPVLKVSLSREDLRSDWLRLSLSPSSSFFDGLDQTVVGKKAEFPWIAWIENPVTGFENS